MTTLYRAYSNVENFKGKDVRFLWFCEKRNGPVAPYEELIENLESIDTYITSPDSKTSALRKSAVDELLTKAEVEELRQYLKQRHGLELDAEPVETPIDRETGGPYGNMPADGQTAYYRLAEELGYNLSVPIRGFVDLGQSLPTISLGVEFVETILKKLKVEPPSHLREIVTSVCTETGLYVDKGTEKTDKLEV